jgi:uncharacterized delta-60 repeat protein
MNNKKQRFEKILYTLLMLLFFTNTSVFSQVQTDWQNRFQSNWGLTDFGRKLKISQDGFIYVGGHSFISGDEAVITLIKYDQDGNTVWQKHSETGVTDNMEDIFLDAQGNLYLVGDHWNGSNFDMLVVKYDRNGTLLWRNTFDGGHWDRANAIGVDSDGNVYICGHTWYQPEFYNMALVKFDSEGQNIWHRTYSNQEQYNDFGHALKIDPSNNIYISGYSNEDLVLLKYSPEGDTTWQGSFNTNKVWMDIEQSYMELDNQGNIILCGNYYSQTAQEDILVLKYDPAGELMWNKIWNSPGSNRDMVSFGAATDNALAVDHSGNIFVSGTIKNPGVSFGEDIITLKYNPEGALQWQHVYDGPANDWDNPLSITVDALGDAYVCGLTVEIVNSLVPEDYLTFKLNGNTGSLLWKETYNGTGDYSDRAYSIGVDKDLNVYVTGITSNDDLLSSLNNDIVTIRYSQGKVGISQNSETPGTFELYQNYPNPFNPVTKINYELPSRDHVSLKVYDISGKEIAVLVDGIAGAGLYTIDFNASGLPSGVYFYRLRSGNSVITKKMTLVK